MFTSKSYFVGTESITSFLEESIKENEDASCPNLAGNKAVGIIGKAAPFNVLETLTFSVVTGEAIKNMFQPGILALVLILLSNGAV